MFSIVELEAETFCTVVGCEVPNILDGISVVVVMKDSGFNVTILRVSPNVLESKSNLFSNKRYGKPSMNILPSSRSNIDCLRNKDPVLEF